MKLRTLSLVLAAVLLPSCAGTQWRDPNTYLRIGQNALQCSGDLFDGATDAEAIGATMCLLGAGISEIANGKRQPPKVTTEQAQAVADKMVPCAAAAEAYLADMENEALRIQLELAARELEQLKKEIEQGESK